MLRGRFLFIIIFMNDRQNGLHPILFVIQPVTMDTMLNKTGRFNKKG